MERKEAREGGRAEGEIEWEWEGLGGGVKTTKKKRMKRDDTGKGCKA